jgi:hypothetical protein
MIQLSARIFGLSTKCCRVFCAGDMKQSRRQSGQNRLNALIERQLFQKNGDTQRRFNVGCRQSDYR